MAFNVAKLLYIHEIYKLFVLVSKLYVNTACLRTLHFIHCFFYSLHSNHSRFSMHHRKEYHGARLDFHKHRGELPSFREHQSILEPVLTDIPEVSIDIRFVFQRANIEHL